MSLRKRLHRRPEPPSQQDVQHALTECPPPWEPIDLNEDARYRRVVEAYGPALVNQALARHDIRAWLLVRYLPDVPPALVDRELASLKRELAEFCELAGGTPDFRAAETWEARWRAAHSNGTRRRRVAS